MRCANKLFLYTFGYGDSPSVGESDTQPSNCEVHTLPLSYRRPSEISFATA